MPFVRWLKGAIDGFFVLHDGQATFGDGVGVNVAKAHRDFLQLYHLSVDKIPLLKLNPANWEQPFEVLRV